MPALTASTAPQGDGSVMIRWNQLQPATGYVAWAFGGLDRGDGAGERGGDMVWWTSSNSREFGGGLWDWMPPATVANLVTQEIVLAPDPKRVVYGKSVEVSDEHGGGRVHK